jgi:hypothetical protein
MILPLTMVKQFLLQRVNPSGTWEFTMTTKAAVNPLLKK